MTAAKKKNSRRKQARFRSSRRKRIRNTVLLLFLLVVLGGTGIGAIYVLRNGTVFDKLEEAYVASREFSGGITDLDSLRADGFAKNLCVVVSDVPMDGVSLGENQKGLLLDLDDRKVLYSKQALQKVYPASITKIMTLLLIFESIEQGKCKLEDKVTVSEYAASMGGSQVFLEPGETQDVNTMIKCISIASANDAAVAMAEHLAGSEQSFVKRMNKKAKALGMKHTHFKNCNGLDDSIESGHYSSAYDVALMSQSLVSKYPDISKYSTVWMDAITHITKKGKKKFGLTNTNKLIRTYQGITGLKTGSTSKAKYCLSATAQRDGISLTAVIMAAPDPKIRFVQAAALLDYGFANCTAFQENPDDITLPPQKISGGITPEIIPRVEKPFQYVLCGDEQSYKPKRKICYRKHLQAPIKEGTIIGSVQYTLNDQEIGSLPIVAAQSIKKACYSDIFLKLLQAIIGK